MKALLAILAIVGLTGVGGYYYIHYVNREGQANFRTAKVERGEMLPTIGATGTIEPEEVVDIGAQVTGIITDLYVDYGSQVEAGQKLAQIDPTKYKATCDQASAALASAKASLDLAKANVANADAMQRRDEDLKQKTPAALVWSQYDIDKAADGVAKAQVGVAQASIGQAQALLNSATTDLGYTEIKSPVKGVIVDRRVNVGQTQVSALSASSLFLLAKDLSRVQIWASVNEADIGRIQVGQKATFTVDTFAGRTFDGKVSQIRLNATMTQNVVTYTVVVTTENEVDEKGELRLKPYMTANVNFEIEHHDNVLKVPNAALRWKPRPQQIAPDARADAMAAMNNRRGDKSKKGSDGDQAANESTSGDKTGAAKNADKDDKANPADKTTSPGAAMTPPAASGSKATGSKPEDWKARADTNAQRHGKPAGTAAKPNNVAAQARKQAKQGPPGSTVSAKNLAAKKEHYDSGLIWTVDGNFVKPIKVKIIATDGTMTEVREVLGKDKTEPKLQDDTEIVTGENVAVEGDDTTNPFMPKLFRGGRREAEVRSKIMELIRLNNITKTYHLGEIDVPVLKGITLTIRRGEMVALMGASGSGKTTLMNILGCLDRPSSGEFWLDGEEMSQLTPNERALVRTAKLGFVFQSFNLLPRTKALHQVTMPLDYSPNRPGTPVALQRSKLLLSRVGLADRADHEPSQMSGGQQQRVAIARSLVNQPALLLADEPTGNLDSHTSVEILRMFQQLNAEGITVILVTHDPKVAKYAHRTIRIADGLIEGDETRVPETAGGPAFTPAIMLDHGGNGNGDGLHLGRLPEGDRTWGGNGSAGSHVDEHAENGAVSRAAATVSVAGNGSAAVAVAEPPVREMATVASQPAAAVAPAKAASSLYGDAEKPQGLGLSSLIPPTFRTAFGALRRNKMRSALTALGVIIGVGAVIAMTGIGQGSKTAIQKTIASMGANNLLVMPGAAASGGVSFGSGSRPTLTPADGEQIELQCPAVAAVAPIVQARAQLVYGRNNWNTRSVVGTSPAYLDVRDWQDMEEGDIFTDRDVLNANKVCLIGTTLKRELFEGQSPIGKEMRISNVTFRVIGVLSPKGANMMGMDQDDIVVAPWTTIKYRVNAALNNAGLSSSAASANAASTAVNSLSNLYPTATPLYDATSPTQTADTPQNISFVTVDQLLVKAASGEQIPEAIREIKSLIRERHHIHTPNEDDDTHDDFNVRDMTEITRTIGQTSNLMGILLLIVAAISLIVGGVGIMNIMLVSVTERTREIGLRMAVGARSYHILRQFLVEAVVLCLVGGGIGVALGWSISLGVRYIQHWPTSVSLMVVCVAVAVSAGVGIVFGFYPAWKASRLDPIEALRYE